MTTYSSIHLTLFFTRGVSLQTWDTVGMFEREVAIYRRLQQHGVQVRFVTYGGPEELAYAERLPGITILCNRWRLRRRTYELLLPWLHAPAFQRSDVIKTNQTNGAEIALRAARFWHKPLIARCGYMWSEFVARQQGNDSTSAHRTRRVEANIFRAAHKVVVTTSAMADDVAQRIPAAKKRITVVPNYVDPDHFRPIHTHEYLWDITFIGRFVPQKNVEALLEAIEPLDVSILLVGNGEQRQSLHQRFGNLNGRVQWQERVPNHELPDYLNQGRVFILPSHYEGHPKALIEAMSCGLPVIGANAPGINNIIQHCDNGYLCNTSVEGIRAAIQEVLADEALQKHMGARARQFALQHFALDQVMQQEMAIIQEVASV
jgi:glycosyltransferase involved in cell wall biosynthesis